MTPRRKLILRSILIVLAALLAVGGWDTATSVGLILWRPALAHQEILLYLVVKGGFVLALCLCFSLAGFWRRFGFTGGPAWHMQPILLPIWIAAACSASKATGIHVSWATAGWVVLSMAVAFGEEAIFRGVIIDALLGNPPVDAPVTQQTARRAIFVSALIFGLVHLSGLAIPGVERQMILGQVLFAGGIGITLAWVRLRSASIWPGMIAHATLDACGIVAAGGINSALTSKTDSHLYLWLMGGLTVLWGVVLTLRWPAVPRQPAE